MMEMKRALRVLFKTVIVLLLLPLILVYGIFLYVKFVNPGAEKTMKETTEFLEQKRSSGNGFGGAEGFVVLDSKLKSSKAYFWIDTENLVLRTDFSAYSQEDAQRNYVWNTRKDSIKPLEVEGPIICFLEEKLYHSNPSESNALPNGNLKGQVYQSVLKEMDNKWIVNSSRQIGSIWGGTPEGYDIFWSDDCQPYFLEISALKTGNHGSFYRTKFAAEWGWILRVPRIPPTIPISKVPKVGLYDLDGDVYYGQRGLKVAGISASLAEDITNLHLSYVGFLDMYLVANKLYGDLAREKILELVDRNGEFQHLSALDDWPTYTDIPSITRKGIFWSGKDYRLKNPAKEDVGAFLKDSFGRVHKVARGESFRSELASDGCSVAFYNPPGFGSADGSLKVFKVCNSEFHGKELQNVDY